MTEEYTCRKCGVIVRGDGFPELKLCDCCSSSLHPGDKKILQEFSETLRRVKNAKTPRERAIALLDADRQAKGLTL